MKENKQYFYLVAIKAAGSETYVVPNKITLQEYKAVKWGRRLATKFKKDEETGAPHFTVKLYRQLISETDTIEFVRVLEPFLGNSEVIEESSKFNSTYGNNGKGFLPKNPRLRKYLIHWRSGSKPTFCEGQDEADAMNHAGYGAGAVAAVDWIERLHDEDFIKTPLSRIFLLKGKQVGGLIQPRKNNNGMGYLTGIIFMDDSRQEEWYPAEEDATSEWKFLKKELFNS